MMKTEFSQYTFVWKNRQNLLVFKNKHWSIIINTGFIFLMIGHLERPCVQVGTIVKIPKFI